MLLKCVICLEEFSGYVLELKQHFKNVHRNDQNRISVYQCPTQNCNADFFNFSNLVRHIKCIHPNTDDGYFVVEDGALNSISSLFEVTEEILPSSSDPTETSPSNCQNDEIDIHEMLRYKAHSFILQMRGDPTVTIPQIDKAIKLSNEILFLTVDKLKKDVEAYVIKESPDYEDRRNLLLNFDILSPFSDVDTKFKQDKMIRRQATFVDPIEITLGTICLKILPKILTRIK